MNWVYRVASLFVLVLVIPNTPPASAQTNLGKRVTIDVTGTTPEAAFELLARELDCTITVDRAVKKPVTLRLVDRPASDIIGTICRSINCEWRFDGKNLFIKPLSAGMRQNAASLKERGRRMEERSKRLQSRLPADMRFDGTPLKDVLNTIGKAAGLKLRPWKDEGSRAVTLDVGGRTVNEALEAAVRHIEGEGVVMTQLDGGSWSQYRLVDKRQEP
ncbi:MAG: hypothetical protein HZB13_02225 [Acidobacteria bacterium]|nr:hypothetical protein [Acidobacteriota bacterium]